MMANEYPHAPWDGNIYQPPFPFVHVAIFYLSGIGKYSKPYMEHLGRDLFHQQFQAAIILMVFDLQGHRSHSFRQKVSCYI